MNNNQLTEVGNIIKEARIKQGYSQNALANASGVTCPTICRIESGKIQKVNSQILKDLSKPLNISYERLMVAAGYVDDVDRLIYDERVERTYLLPEEAIKELNSYIQYLKYKYSVNK